MKLLVSNKSRWISVKVRLPDVQQPSKFEVKMNIDELNNIKRVQVKGKAWYGDGKWNTNPSQKITHWLEKNTN